jgi:predicted metal-dependent enzyme (double-stranded beta helix superfamily)
MSDEWLVDQRGEALVLQPFSLEVADDRPYRLYRFLTEVEDIVTTLVDPIEQLQAIVPRVRRLLTGSWLEIMPILPDPDLGWEVVTLYDEPLFPLTVQMVAWAPGTQSPVHNHGCWGIVALMSGQEHNQFWRRSPTDESPDRLEVTGETIVDPGQIITFLPEAIHQITALGSTPTISFNLYGETDYDQRFEFDLDSNQAALF